MKRNQDPNWLNVLATSFILLAVLLGLVPTSYAQTTPPDCQTACVIITANRLIGYVKPTDEPTPPVTSLPVPTPPPVIPTPPPAPTPAPEPTPPPPTAPEPTPPAPQPLSTPVFSPQNGAVAFGTVVTLAASNIPSGGVLEYSTDNGATWVAGSQFTVNDKMTVQGRLRLNDQVSTSANASFTRYFQRILIIGNSIMNTTAIPEIGWLNSNGMAASAPDKDFVHLTVSHLQTLNPATAYRLQGAGNFERYYGQSNYSLDEFNEAVQQFKPDLILVRMGENVEDSGVPGRDFESNFRQLLERLASLSGSQPVKMVCTTSVWDRPQADAVIRKVTNEKGHTLVELSDMVGKGQYFASEYSNGAVAAHPNDAGMLRIADAIWDKLK